jgi:hypothetical protein
MKDQPTAPIATKFKSTVCKIAGSLCLVYGITLFGSQIIYYLKSGTWLSPSTASLFAQAAQDGAWPTRLVPYLSDERVFNYLYQFTIAEWVGVQRIVSWLTTHTALWFASTLVGMVAFGAANMVEERAKASRSDG